MNIVAQLVIAAILNFLGMAPETQELATPGKAEIFIEKELAIMLPEENKLCHYYVFKEAREVN